MKDHTSCKDLIAVVMDYLDDELDAQTLDELETHLETCKNCTTLVSTLRKTILLSRQAAAEGELPADVRQRLFASLHLGEYCE
jgi:anti-sigma factor (TIGR02949 family)